MSSGRHNISDSPRKYIFSNSEIAKKHLKIFASDPLSGAAEYISALNSLAHKSTDFLGDFVTAQDKNPIFFQTLKSKKHPEIIQFIDDYLESNDALFQELKKHVLDYLKDKNPRDDIRLLTLATMNGEQLKTLTSQTHIVFRDLLAVETAIYRGDQKSSSTVDIVAQLTSDARKSTVVAIATPTPTPAPPSVSTENTPAIAAEPVTPPISAPVEEKKLESATLPMSLCSLVQPDHFLPPTPVPEVPKNSRQEESYASSWGATFARVANKTYSLASEAGTSVGTSVVNYFSPKN
jgi:hypothetical protein